MNFTANLVVCFLLVSAFAQKQQVQRGMRGPPLPPVEPTVEAVAEYLDQVSNHDYAMEQDLDNPCEVPDVYLVQDGQEVGVGKPISTTETLEDFYGYDPFSNSYTGSDALKKHWAGKRSLVTIHQSKLTCELSLVFLNSKPWEGDASMHLRMWVTGDLHNIVVKDDPAFDKFMLFDDKYDSIYLRQQGKTGFEWIWGIEDSDGAGQPLPDPDWTGCIEVVAEFGQPEEYLNLQTPNEWKYVSGGDGASTSTIDLDPDNTLFVCIGDLPRDLSDESMSEFASNSDPFPEVCNEDIRYGVCGYCTRPVCHWHWICNIQRFMNCNFGTDISPYGG